MFSILCIDDELESNSYLDMIKPPGCTLIPVTNEREFYRVTSSELLDLVILDIDFGGGIGLKLLDEIINRVHPVPLVVHSRTVLPEVVVRCIRRGARDFMAKPVARGRFSAVLSQTVTTRAKCQHYRSEEDAVLGADRVREQFCQLAGRFAKGGMACFLSGEPGTGMSLVARSLHDWQMGSLYERSSSPRRDRFMAYSPRGREFCVQQNDLFGDPCSVSVGGLIGKLNGGTVFIEHVECLEPGLQVDLARMLESGRVGANPLRGRLVYGSNHKLDDLVREGKMVADLARHLFPMQLHLPALRERRSNFLSLVWHYIDQYREQNPASRIKSLGQGVLERLQEHQWPGNLPDLRNCIEEACGRCETETLELACIRFPQFIPESGNHGR